MKQNVLIFDPISYLGGSKIATQEMLHVAKQRSIHFYIVTANRDNWQSALAHGNCSVYSYPTIAMLLAEQGLKYWLLQAYHWLVLLVITLRLPKIHRLMGISGPGLDMPLYLFKLMFKTPITQVIHGKVARSRSIGYCLSVAEKVFYLPCAKKSLFGALCRYYEKTAPSMANTDRARMVFERNNFVPFTNGLSAEQWPTECDAQSAQLFWAASLLKWKGLDLLVEALKIHPQDIDCHVCYIQPQQTQLAVSEPDLTLTRCHWYQQPNHLDHIRSQCSIFISTSQNEPFGLSILEALAAGLCVVIPDDGAFWAEKLTDGEHCIKYQPNSAKDLRQKIEQLLASPCNRQRLSRNGRTLAKLYRSDICYQPIIDSLGGKPTRNVVPLGRTREKGAL
ncbi:glycosyltransferase family 4 protein [Vibrio vulnificus]|uniref:glycosyltransferase family 4 protein n=1 Tax=Vibrio vulnificus TaxID=672 RepID=UPI0005074656|nr:glycosyltransferase family 4 protein [Vibrio vulnificus]EIE1227151.1 glycosyltransferase family 4 protein [Vibrio vulnificus]EJS4044625.1 glycosyltransferase family 4 protein [Vibrio vulnificus]KFK54721.1 glycosyltransferase [Vibrio vulnificus]